MLLVCILVFFNIVFFICETILELLYFNLPLFAVVRYEVRGVRVRYSG